MNKKNVILYIAALIACFLLGAGGALVLRMIDARAITPLSGGQEMDFPEFGFTLSVPQDFRLFDHTDENYASGGNALYAAALAGNEDILYLFCYENETGDRLADHSEQDVVSHYMRAGASDVRMRSFGGRRFICYLANVEGEHGVETWYSCETWDETLQIVFETDMPPERVLPILATLSFTDVQ